MPVYILLSTLTVQGVQTLKSNPDRLRAVNQDVEELGCKVLHQWATLGEFDFINVWIFVEPRAPSETDTRAIVASSGASTTLMKSSSPSVAHWCSTLQPSSSTSWFTARRRSGFDFSV